MWPLVAGMAASAVASYMAQKNANKGAGEASVVPAVLDIEDAPERVYQEQYGQKTPYEPFMPYMFGTGGAGRMFGTPQVSPAYNDYLTTLVNGSQGLNTSQMLGGAQFGGPPRMYGGPMFGTPALPNFDHRNNTYFNPYTMPQQLPPMFREPVRDQVAQVEEDDSTPWRLRQDETLNAIPEIWDDRRKIWRSAHNLRPSALNSDRYEYVG